MRAWSCAAIPLLLTSCVPLMTPAPRTVEPDTPLDCTDTYWPPAAIAAGAIAMLGFSVWVAHVVDEECNADHPDGCDPQGGIAVGLPLVAAIGLALGAEAGRRQVSRCRDAKSWQLETRLPPSAGEIGSACVPVYGGAGRCNAGTCVRGVCRPATPKSDDVRRMCAEAKGRWRAGLLADLPPACRSPIR